MLVIASADTDITTAVAFLVPACKVRNQDVPSFDYKPFLPQFWLCPVSLRAEEPLEECSECPVLAGQLAAGWRYRWSLTPGPN